MVDTQAISQSLVPDYIRSLKVYQAGKPVEELAREKNLSRISKLASNENPLGPSPLALAEMAKSLSSLQQYPDMHAYRLKSKLSEIYKLKPENIILGNGSEGIMAYICRAFLHPGFEVLTCEKTFIGFYILARSVGAELKTVPLTDDYRFNVKTLAANITDKTKIIYLANPNNPTGTYIKKDEFDYLMEHVPGHVLVILDEAYFEFAREREDYPDSMEYRYDNVITLRTFSKAYGLAGIRVGYGFGHEDLIANLTKVKLPFEPNLLAQNGAWGALEDQVHLQRTVHNNNLMYEKTFKYLQDKGFNPVEAVTNFIMFKTGSFEASEWMFNELLNKGVIIRPLKANEMPDYVRVSLGLPNEMDHFFKAMDEILPEYDQKFRSQK